jgi:hypothetical protein
MSAKVTQLDINIGGSSTGAVAAMDRVEKRAQTFEQRIKQHFLERRQSGEAAADKLFGSGEQFVDFALRGGAQAAILSFAIRGVNEGLEKMNDRFREDGLSAKSFAGGLLDIVGSIPILGDAFKFGTNIGEAIRSWGSSLLTLGIKDALPGEREYERIRKINEALTELRNRLAGTVNRGFDSERSQARLDVQAEFTRIAGLGGGDETKKLRDQATAIYRRKLLDIEQREYEERKSFTRKGEQEISDIRAAAAQGILRAEGLNLEADISALRDANNKRKELIKQDAEEEKRKRPKDAKEIDALTKQRLAASDFGYDQSAERAKEDDNKRRVDAGKQANQVLLQSRMDYLDQITKGTDRAAAKEAQQQLDRLRLAEEFDRRIEALEAVANDKSLSRTQRELAEEQLKKTQKQRSEALEAPDKATPESLLGATARSESSRFLTGVASASRESAATFTTASATTATAKNTEKIAEVFARLAAALEAQNNFPLPNFN